MDARRLGLVVAAALLVATTSVVRFAAAATADAPIRRYPTVEAARAGLFGRDAQPSTTPIRYHGGVDGIGVTIGQPKIYLVFWGAQWGGENPAGSLHFGGDHVGVAPRLAALFNGLGTNGELWSGVMTQYCEGVPAGSVVCPTSAPHVPYPNGSVLAGVWLDTALPAPVFATPYEIGAKAVEAAGHFGNVTPESNRNAQYVIVSPTGTHPDGFNTESGGFCAWHAFNGNVGVTSPYGDVAFTTFPISRTSE